MCYMKLKVLESNSYFLGRVMYYVKWKVLESNSDLLFLWGGVNVLHEIESA